MKYIRTLWCITLCSPYSYVFNSCKAVSRNIQNVSFSSKVEGPPWRILFFGSDNFSLTCIQPICAKLRTQTLISDLGVVSRPGSIIHRFAEQENLTIYDWPIDYNVIKDKFDIGIVVSFGHLLPERLLNTIPLGIINVHGSLLPRWRGAAPIVYAVKNGDTETGVTIMRVRPKRFDRGEILKQYRCSIGPDELAIDLHDKLAKYGAQLLMECLRDLLRCLEMATPQPEEGVTLAPRLNASIAVVNWSTMDAKTVYNLYRALAHLYPLNCNWYNAQIRLFEIQPYRGVDSNTIRREDYQMSNKSALKFLNTVESDKTSSHKNTNEDIKPGLVRWNPDTKLLRIQCADGNYVSCTCLALAGRKKMSPADFYNGYLSKRKKSEWILT